MYCTTRRGPPTRPFQVYAVFYDGLDETFQSGRQVLGPLVRSAGAFPRTGHTRVDGPCQGQLEPRVSIVFNVGFRSSCDV